MIQLKNLSKKFGDQIILENVNLEFSAGKIYGIAGENGAGKTTLFRCIAGLEVYQGEIFSEFQPLKNHLGLLLTEPFFFSKMTGKEYIRLLTKARGLEINSIEERNIFDLPLDHYASSYSTGMKKKLALTAILLQENKYYIFDEPFNGVDIQSNLILTEILLELKKLNKTILLSSHIFATLSEICDEIHLMRKGEPIKTVQKENYKNLEEEMKTLTMGNKIDRLKLR